MLLTFEIFRCRSFFSIPSQLDAITDAIFTHAELQPLPLECRYAAGFSYCRRRRQSR